MNRQIKISIISSSERWIYGIFTSYRFSNFQTRIKLDAGFFIYR